MKTSPIQNAFRVLLGLAMMLAGTAHVTVKRKEFRAQVPKWLPEDPKFMDFVVVSSGVVEIAMGLAMIFPGRCKVQIGLALALFYMLVFPGNISQYTHHIDAFGLDTNKERFNRLFFQPVLIMWALWSSGALKYLEQQKAKKNISRRITLL